jgi:hypothetical protein
MTQLSHFKTTKPRKQVFFDKKKNNLLILTAAWLLQLNHSHAKATTIKILKTSISLPETVLLSLVLSNFMIAATSYLRLKAASEKNVTASSSDHGWIDCGQISKFIWTFWLDIIIFW